MTLHIGFTCRHPKTVTRATQLHHSSADILKYVHKLEGSYEIKLHHIFTHNSEMGELMAQLYRSTLLQFISKQLQTP
jgi:hypothetical protein